MSDGRTYWWAKDSAWWRRERIIALGLEFGADGPAVVDWLCCEAKAQNDGGQVKTGRRAIAHGSFVAVEVVGHVLSRAVTLGVLDDLDETAGVLTCRISGWRADQERGRAAARKADQRAREETETPDDQRDHAPRAIEPAASLSRPVTPGHGEAPTEQESRTTELPPNPPKGGRDRDLVAFDEAMTAWAREQFPGAQPGLVASAVQRLRSRGIEPTRAALLEQGARHPVYALTAHQQAAPAA
jgi:hypothetical protein